MSSWQKTFDRLDRISRDRALTDAESLMLERAIDKLDVSRDNRGGKRPAANAWSRELEARFSDLIANGMTPRQAGIAVGKTASAGIGKFNRMRQFYGCREEMLDEHEVALGRAEAATKLRARNKPELKAAA